MPLRLDSSIVQVMRDWGAPPEDIARAEELADQAQAVADAAGDCEVWAENWRAFQTFDACTQWRYAGTDGQRVGLDYAGVAVWLDHIESHPKRRRQLFDDLLVLERAAVDAFAELAKQERT